MNSAFPMIVALLTLSMANAADHGSERTIKLFVPGQRSEAPKGHKPTGPDQDKLLKAFALTMREEAYDESQAILEKIDSKKIDLGLFHFLRLVNFNKLNMREQALQELKAFDEGFYEIPQRYRDLILLMREDMKDWKEGDLSDIARNMDKSANRLAQGKGGKKTIEIGEKIVSDLDQIIKKLEEPPKDQKEGGNGQSDGSSKPEGKKGENKKSNSPMEDSELGGGIGKGQVDQKKLKNIAQNWGKLPEKERAKAMMEITRDLPPRYREVIENYFRSLASSQP